MGEEKADESGKSKKNDDKKNLLITTDSFLPRWDGISRFLLEVIPYLTEHFNVRVVAPNYGGSSLERLVEVIKMPLSEREVGDYQISSVHKKKLRREIRKADVVFNQSLGRIGVSSIRNSKKMGRPVVSFTHSLEWELFPKAISNLFLKKLIQPVTKLFVRYFYNKCSSLICPSENVADNITWRGVHVKKKVVHLGVDSSKFKKGAKEKAREKTGLPKNAFIVGFHGRLAREKNLLTLLRAFLRIDEEKKRLVIIGEGVPELKKTLSKKDVVLPGKKNNVVPWLQAMDVYVMPSFTETTSLAVLEAMSCELPVISSKVGFIKQYIEDGENGFFFDKRETYDLFKKLVKLKKDKGLRKKVGKKARKTVKKNFSWEDTREKIKDELEKRALDKR